MLMEAIKAYYINIINFNGRASRMEYWGLQLYSFIIFFMILLMAESPVFFIVLIIHVIASLSLQVRRLHDIDKSGWWILLGLIPYIGSLGLFVFSCLRGDEMDNLYGPSPIISDNNQQQNNKELNLATKYKINNVVTQTSSSTSNEVDANDSPLHSRNTEKQNGVIFEE